MNAFWSFLLALSIAASASAQGLRREAVNGAILGGAIGGIVGHNSGDLRHNGWRGAAIGAGSGLIVGSMIGEHRDRQWRTHGRRSAAPHVYLNRYPHRYVGHHGYHGRSGYGYGRHWSGVGYRQPGYGYVAYDSYGYSGYGGIGYSEPSYRASGALWGGLLGAVIGHNSGDLRHSAWRGAGYGAAAGYLFGSIADRNRAQTEAYAERQPVLAMTSAPEVRPDPAPPVSRPAPVVTVANERASSSMSSANRLFGR